MSTQALPHKEDAGVKGAEYLETEAPPVTMPVTHGRPQPVRRFIRPAVFLALAFVVIVVIALIARRPRAESPASTLHIAPITSFQGFELEPALSPEGNKPL